MHITVVLFLGAGASVPADVPDTKKFVDRFKDHIKSQDEKHRTVAKLLEVLEEYVRVNPMRQVDIELLLEALERLENRESDVLPYFTKGGDYIMEGYLDKGPIRDELREFIRSNVMVQKNQIEYLQYLRELVAVYGTPAEGGPLSVFTVNYDNCIEQFCDLFSLNFCDGFQIEWTPKLFESPKYDIHLFKLHGSTNWYRTQSGRHIRIPIRSEKGKVELDTGEIAETFIVFPGLKSTYYEPYLDMLGIMKDRLKRTDIVVVVGYSFRDDDIKKIFWDIAATNRRLKVVLVSPSASRVYEKQLAFKADRRHSPLTRRCLVLPFLFERVLPILNKTYISNLKDVILQERSIERQKALGQAYDYVPFLGRCIDCGFIEKVMPLFPITDFGKDWKSKLRVATLSMAYLEARDTEPNLEEKQKLFMDSLKIMLSDNLLIRVGTRKNVELFLQPCGPGIEVLRPLPIIDHIGIIENEIESIADMVREDRRDDVVKVFEPLRKFIGCFSDIQWEERIELSVYVDLRREEYEEETQRIDEILQGRTGESELPKEEVDEISEIIDSIEQSRLNGCFGN
jgi:hypothetical protein